MLIPWEYMCTTHSAQPWGQALFIWVVKHPTKIIPTMLPMVNGNHDEQTISLFPPFLLVSTVGPATYGFVKQGIPCLQIIPCAWKGTVCAIGINASGCKLEALNIPNRLESSVALYSTESKTPSSSANACWLFSLAVGTKSNSVMYTFGEVDCKVWLPKQILIPLPPRPPLPPRATLLPQPTAADKLCILYGMCCDPSTCNGVKNI